MKISVKTLKGNHFDLTVSPADTVKNGLDAGFDLVLVMVMVMFMWLCELCMWIRKMGG